MLEISYSTDRKTETRIYAGTDAFNKVKRLHSGGRNIFVYDAGIPANELSRISSFVESYLSDVVFIEATGGEDAKRLGYVEEMAREMIAWGVRRNSVVVIAGGGGVLDSINFLASILLRGIRTILIPTTLLAMVDAAIGGKTAVNLDSVKNMLGTFHHPEMVIIDFSIIDNLRPRLIRSGMGEIIKTLFLAGKQDILLESGKEKIYQSVEASVLYKAEVVERDPYETTGERKFLNFGHTIGHGIESAYIGKLSHGEAVANALPVEQYCAEKITGHGQGLYRDIHEMVEKNDLLVKGLDVDRIFTYVWYDKKSVSSSEVELVYLKKPGEPALIRVAIEELRRAAGEYFSR